MSRREPRFRARVRIFVAVFIAGLALGAAALPASAEDESAQQVLKRAEKFLKKAKTVQFKADIGPAGVAPVGTLEESAIFPNRGRTVLTLGTNVQDTLIVGDRVFFRGGTAGNYTKPPGSGYGELPIFGVPQDLKYLVDEVQDPQILSTGPDGTVLRLTFKKPGNVYRVAGDPYTSAHLDLTVARTGEPTAATVAASGPSGEVAATAGKLTWNKRVALPRPPLAEDPVDKAAVSGFSDAPLRQPKALPRRWKLAQADVLRAEETAEGCPEVHIAYGVGQRVGRDFADTFQFPTTCARGLAGGQPLTIGPYQGTIATDESFQVPRTVAEFDADGTTIQVTTTLTPDEFAKVWGSLTALNLDKPPKANLPVASSSAT